jgi:hypothetical protein
MARATILRGPCKITFNSKVFMSKGDVTIKHVMDLLPIPTSRFGKIDDHVTSVMDVIEFEPDGRFLVASLSTMLPYTTKAIGSSCFGADSPLTINTLDGTQRVYRAAAVTTKKQTIRLGTQNTMFGPMQFTCLYGGAVAPSDAGSLFTDSSVSYPGDANYAGSDVLTLPYSLAWGATAPWDSFMSKDGIEISIDCTLEQERSQSHGTYDYIFQDMAVSATLEPDGPTALEAATACKIQGSGATLGRSLNANSNDLIITATGVWIKLSKASPVNPNERHSAKVRRMGALEFRATRNITSGAADPLFVIDDEAPV